MRIGEVDPRDDAAFAGWFEVLSASLRDERPGEATWTAHEQREISLSLVRPGGPRRGTLVTATDDGQVLGALRVHVYERDNPTLAAVLLHVHPQHRRRGVGRALLAEATARARAVGRIVLSAELDEPGPGAPGRAFAQAVGARCGQLETRRDLSLPVDTEELAALERAYLPYAQGYRFLSWRDRTPEHLLDQHSYLMRRMSTEAPLGDMPYGEEDWDAERLRHHEQDILAQRRTWFTAAAERDGRLVAFSDLGVPLGVPERAYQWSTLVLPEHRGHRLGTLLKIMTTRDLQEASPATRLLSTWNAQVNAPMIAVNEALGYRPAGTLSLWMLPV